MVNKNEPKPTPNKEEKVKKEQDGKNDQGKKDVQNKVDKGEGHGHGRPAQAGQGGQERRGGQHGGQDRRNNRRGGFVGGQRGGHMGRGDHNKQQQQQQQQQQQRQQQEQQFEEDYAAAMEEEDQEPQPERKFTGRCRLFVGNLTNDTNEEDFKKMFEPYGDFTEIFLNASRGFGFIRMDFRKNAEAAKSALDGLQRKGRMLRVRFATHGAALKVKHLSPFVTNELLMQAFSMFGEVERAVVIVDDRGKPLGEGIVEFARKPGAQAALKRISEGVFMLTAAPRPISVEPLEQKDEDDGLQEKFVQKTGDFIREREQLPRFAAPGSFEFEFGQKWKDLYLMLEEGERNLKRQFEEGLAKLEIEQAGAMMEHQTAMLRQDLLRRQEELNRLEEQHRMEMQRRLEMRRQEDERRHAEEDQRRQQELEMRRQQEERRQQELYRQGGDFGMGADYDIGMGGSGGAGNYAAGGNMQGAMPQRQSRFDQPPGFNNQGGSQGNNAGNLMGMGGSGSGNSGMGRGGHMGGGNDRMMERGGGGGSGGGRRSNDQNLRSGPGSTGSANREGGNREGQPGADEYYEPKRQRRY